MRKCKAGPIDARRVGYAGVFVFLVAGPIVCRAADPTSAATLDEALATVLDAKPGGADGAETAAAWKVVSQATYQQLPMIFGALDKAGPLAANWISMALDRIYASQNAVGKALPIDLLKQTALDTSHALLTRKAAIELIRRAGVHHIESLQSQFLNDPEAELRRPTIQKGIENAKKMVEEGASNSRQLAAWTKLLESARDQDQVTTIVRAMKQLGQEVDLAAHFGYLVNWRVIGPFDNTDSRGFDVAFPPESLNLDNYNGTDGVFSKQKLAGKTGSVAWKDVVASASRGNVDLNKEVGKLKDVVAYGAAVFVSDREQQVDVRLRVQNSFKIWLNGQLIMAQPVGHTGNAFDQYTVRATLKKGRNLFLIKSCQVNLKGSTEFYENWHFCVRVCDSTGASILSTDREVQ